MSDEKIVLSFPVKNRFLFLSCEREFEKKNHHHEIELRSPIIGNVRFHARALVGGRATTPVHLPHNGAKIFVETRRLPVFEVSHAMTAVFFFGTSSD